MVKKQTQIVQYNTEAVYTESTCVHWKVPLLLHIIYNTVTQEVLLSVKSTTQYCEEG